MLFILRIQTKHNKEKLLLSLLLSPVILKLIHSQPHWTGICPTRHLPAGSFSRALAEERPTLTNESHVKHQHSQSNNGGETPSAPLALLHRDRKTSRTETFPKAEIHLQKCQAACSKLYELYGVKRQENARRVTPLQGRSDTVWQFASTEALSS